jgi:RNA polymerase sigma-70 factor (ECF subfamily)
VELEKTDDDRILVDKIMSGENRAFEAFIFKYKKLVGHIVFRLIKDKEDREDICQDIFVKVYRNLGSFQFSSKLSTWVATIAYNTCVNFLEKKREPLSADFMTDEKINETADDSHEPPDRLIESKEISAFVRKEIDKLPPVYKAAITLYHLNEMSYEEIAGAMRLPEGTVKSHLFRARKILKDKLMILYRQEDLCR